MIYFWMGVFLATLLGILYGVFIGNVWVLFAVIGGGFFIVIIDMVIEAFTQKD